MSERTNGKRTDYSFWKTTKKLNEPIILNAPIRNADGNWARNNTQKVNRFAEHLKYNTILCME